MYSIFSLYNMEYVTLGSYRVPEEFLQTSPGSHRGPETFPQSSQSIPTEFLKRSLRVPEMFP
jgi:hypothetical protein